MNFDITIYGAPAEVKRGKFETDHRQSNEEFRARFDNEKYVFVTDGCSINTNNCFIRKDGDDESIYFVKNQNTYTVYNNKNTVNGSIRETPDKKFILDWCLPDWVPNPLNKRRFDSFSEIVRALFEHYQPINGLSYTRGVINSNFIAAGWSYEYKAEKLLQEMPVNTYILILERIFHKGVDKIRQKTIPWRKEYSYSTIDKDVSARVKREAVLCNSLLDISFLTNFSLQTLQKEIEGWDPCQFLHGIQHLILNGNVAKNKNLRTYVEILLFVAKSNRTDIEIHIDNKTISDFVVSDSYCREVLSRMQLELKGDPLRWAMDKFLEVIISNTHFKDKTYPVTEDSTWHALYDNPNKKSNMKVYLPNSERYIHVHDGILGIFSAKLKIDLLHDESKKGTQVLTFEGYPDEVVEQFLRVAYGFYPDFSKCKLIEILRLGSEMESWYFINLANKSFNDMFDVSRANIECPYELMKSMIELKLWKCLTNNAQFFRVLGMYWSEIIERLPSTERDAFRNDFLNQWTQYLNSNCKVIKG